MNNQSPANVEEYIQNAPAPVQPLLTELRRIIRETAPEAEERISYQMPGYYFNGPLVYFGGFKNHVSLFATGSPIVERFKKELKDCKRSKGTIQFPLDQPLPTHLIKQIVQARLEENQAKG